MTRLAFLFACPLLQTDLCSCWLLPEQCRRGRTGSSMISHILSILFLISKMNYFSFFSAFIFFLFFCVTHMCNRLPVFLIAPSVPSGEPEISPIFFP